jgi:hypothetical protein
LDYDAETTNPDQGPPSRKPGVDLLISQQYEQYKTFWTEKFFQLHRNEEELNRIFIKIYGLEEELTPDVELKDVTILQPEKIITLKGDLNLSRQRLLNSSSHGVLVVCLAGTHPTNPDSSSQTRERH